MANVIPSHPLFNDARICNHIPSSHEYPDITPYTNYPLDFLHFTTPFSRLSLVSAWGRGVGIFDRSSGNDTLRCLFYPFIVHPIFPLVIFRSTVIAFCNVCVSLPSGFFFPSLCCFGSLYKSSHTITTPHAGHFFIDHQSPLPSLLPFTHTLLRPFSVSAPTPRQPPLFVRYGLCLLCL